LLHAVIVSQEEERRRIGMDLHDEVGTVLSALRMSIVNLPDAPGVAALPEFKREGGRIIDGVITNVRSIAHNLSPFTDGAYGFMDALEDLCDQINQSGELRISLGFPGGDGLNQLPGSAGLALYRVIAELINNTLKHAKAANIVILVEAEGALMRIAYKDDGIGMENGPVSHGMGMRNMESRLGMIGATYTIDKEKRQGFGLQIKLPLHHLS
jgi:signal transduction histidine kinase